MPKFNSSHLLLLIHQMPIKIIKDLQGNSAVLILDATPLGNLSWSINCFPSTRSNRWDHRFGIDPQDWTCSAPSPPGELKVVFILQEGYVVFFFYFFFPLLNVVFLCHWDANFPSKFTGSDAYLSIHVTHILFPLKTDKEAQSRRGILELLLRNNARES